MSDKYILDAGGDPVLEPDLLTWARWFEKAEHRRLAVTRTPDGTPVSTVFLGIDHNFSGGPPILWETMVFDTTAATASWQGWQDRYATREDAKRGHDAIVEAITAGKQPEEL